MPRPRHAAAAALLALAAASLLAPFALVYDPWAWLVWGREITGLELDTAAGPSWKPLPVIVTTALAPAGSAAPDLWLLVSRVGWLAAVALAWRLAGRLLFPARFATSLAAWVAPKRVRRARLAAGLVAALGVVLLLDPFTAWTLQFAGGLSEPLLVALVLGAIDRQLSGRPDQALGLGFAAALLRPEAWPLLAVYAVWLWRNEPELRRWLVAGGLALPVLWLVPDLVGSGDPLTGARRAREGSGTPLGEGFEAIGRALEMVLAGLWVTAAYAVISARRTGERAIPVLAAGALAWIGVVAILAAAGYAGLPRFAAPAAAIACALGGVGLVRLLAAVDGMRRSDRRRGAIALTAALVAAIALQAGFRTAEIPGDLDEAADHSTAVAHLFELAERIGPDSIVACGPVATTDALMLPALAWRLELPLSDVDVRIATTPSAGTTFVAASAPAAARDAIAAAGRPLGTEGSWAAYAISCAGERDIAAAAAG